MFYQNECYPKSIPKLFLIAGYENKPGTGNSRLKN